MSRHGDRTREEWEAMVLRDLQNLRVALGDLGPALARAAELIRELQAERKSP